MFCSQNCIRDEALSIYLSVNNGVTSNRGNQQFRCDDYSYYRGADKSLARAGSKRSTVTEDFDIHISYL